MYWFLGSPLNINDLKGHHRVLTSADRPTIPIAVVDDEEFAYLNILKKHGFSIRHFHDVENLQDLGPYPVILCDIKGVGKHFDSKYEGAYLLAEIRKRYPAKIIIAYTGHMMDAGYNKFFSMADRTMKKDTSSDEWVEVLDDAIRDASNPVFQWKRLRASLLEKEIALHDLCILESQFVAAMQNNDRDFPTAKIVKRLSDENQQLLVDFSKGLARKAIAGI